MQGEGSGGAARAEDGHQHRDHDHPGALGVLWGGRDYRGGQFLRPGHAERDVVVHSAVRAGRVLWLGGAAPGPAWARPGRATWQRERQLKRLG